MRHLTYEKSLEKGSVYIPKFTRLKKTEVEHYEFIKSIPVGSEMGHILHAGDEFIMCLSKDDTVSFYPRLKEPMGYTKPTIADLEALAATFNAAYQRELKSKAFTEKYRKAGEGPKSKQNQ